MSSKTIQVNIAGRDYTLRGDDESRVRQSAHEVDGQIRQIQQKLNEQSTSTLSILAALNLAERFHASERQSQADADYVVRELEKMAEFLQNCCNISGAS
ncbi:MAG TPA: cell division protein ZapA [Patescibacteria group bacterium]|nr:cell division protein ZapA [Patescibacteria group bacterium]